MGKIDIKGDIVSDDAGAFYEYFGMSSTYPKLVQDAIANDEDEEISLTLRQTVVMCLQPVKSIQC